MSGRKQWQAKHIADGLMLQVVYSLAVKEGPNPTHPDWQDGQNWVMSWDVEDNIQRLVPGAPVKVIHAKLKGLLRRRVLEGCPCGCRGDWYLNSAQIAKGRPDLIEVTERYGEEYWKKKRAAAKPLSSAESCDLTRSIRASAFRAAGIVRLESEEKQ